MAHLITVVTTSPCKNSACARAVSYTHLDVYKRQVEKVPFASAAKESVTDYNNIAFMGSNVVSGSASAVVVCVGDNTLFGSMASAVAGEAVETSFTKGVNAVSWVLIRFMLVMVPLVFFINGITKGDWLDAFLFGISIAVGLTPEMLPMIVTTCLAKGAVSMSKKQTIVKNLNSIQNFGAMDILCTDKTGTLTQDRVVLEYHLNVNGKDDTRVPVSYTHLDVYKRQVLDLAYLNSLYHTGVSNHLDAAILRYQEMPGKDGHFQELEKMHPKLDELPFNHERKFASVLVKGKEKNLLIIKGSVDEVCRRCGFVEYKGNRNVMEEDGLASVHAVVDEMTEDGMKVLAVAYKELGQDYLDTKDEQNFVLLGYLAFFDAPKQTAAAAISKLQKLHVGIRVLKMCIRDRDIIKLFQTSMLRYRE